MEKIKVGDYIRTEFGNIGKFYRPASENSDVYYIYINKDGSKITSRYDSIVKHSPNIIDLIEVGDIIEINNNKYEVILDKSYEKLGLLIPNKEHLATRHCSLEYIFSNEGMKEFKIKSIVTKEQFNNISYEV